MHYWAAVGIAINSISIDVAEPDSEAELVEWLWQVSRRYVDVIERI